MIRRIARALLAPLGAGDDSQRVIEARRRATDERPYADLTDLELERQYVGTTLHIREQDLEGDYLTPAINRARDFREEWLERGNALEELHAAVDVAADEPVALSPGGGVE